MFEAQEADVVDVFAAFELLDLLLQELLVGLTVHLELVAVRQDRLALKRVQPAVHYQKPYLLIVKFYVFIF